MSKTMISLQKISNGDSLMQNARTKKQQGSGIGARLKLKPPHERVGEDVGDGGSAQAAADFAVNRAMTEGEGTKNKAATSITQAGKHGQHQPTAAAMHGGRAALKETWGDKYRKDYIQSGSKAGKRATEMGREATRPYDKKEPESRSEKF
jgi:hypothetical protein